MGELAWETFFEPGAELRKLLQRIDFAVCLFFLLDFGIRFHKAPHKLKFMKWGWIDLISSIPVPAWNGLFVGRTLRIFRMLRLIRAYPSFHSFIATLYEDVPQGTLTSIPIITFFVVLFASISILACERDYPGANIRTAGDALWWSMTTITTVGYGDRFPVSTEGRLVAVFLMVAGGGLFGTFTAVVSMMFLRTARKDGSDARAERIERQLHEIQEHLKELRASRDADPTLTD